MTNMQIDHAKGAAFESRLVGMLNAGALSLMVSIGHRTGLFDVMSMKPAPVHRRWWRNYLAVP